MRNEHFTTCQSDVLITLKCLFLCFMYDVCHAYVYQEHIVPMELRRGCQITESRVTHSCELSCGCWELNLGYLQEQQAPLIDEPSLEPPPPLLNLPPSIYTITALFQLLIIILSLNQPEAWQALCPPSLSEWRAQNKFNLASAAT